MLKRTVSVLSKASALPSVRLDVGSFLLKNIQKRTFSSIWRANLYQQPRNLTSLSRCTFASQPSHTKMAMPALSPTMEQGNIVKWNVKEGDKVEAGDALCDVETDKATLSFDVQDSGYIAKILVPDGTKGVKVGTPIVILVEEQADVKAFADYKGDDQAQPKQAAKEEPKKQEQEQPKEQKKEQKEAGTGDKAAKTESKGHGGEHHWTENIRGEHRKNVLIRFTHGSGRGAQAHSHEGRVIASPLARRLAREKGIDLSQVSGTGPNGRVLAHNVQSFTPKEAAKEERPKTAAAPEKKAIQQPKAVTDVQNPYTDIPVTSIREIIAKRLLESKTTIPHFYIKMEIYMDEAIAIREKLNQDAKSKISFNDMFIKAAALCCIAIPEVNSQWHGTFIRKFKNADISVAVDTGSGLITPIVFAANTKGLSEIAATTKQLIEKAKSNTLKPQEFQGGTFSISNLGMLGVSRFSAVINPPQASILAVGKTGKKVVDQKGEYKEVNVMEVVLSGDHRVVDGAVAARWLQAFKNYLEKPLTMML